MFAALNEASGFATEVSVFNPTAAAHNATVIVFRADGTLAGSAQLAVPAGGRTTRRLATLVAAAAGQSTGHFAVENAAALFASATIFETSGNSLASVPSQSVGVTGTTGLRVLSAAFNAAIRALSLTWASQPGATYSVQQSADLKVWQNVQIGISAGTGATTSITTPSGPAAQDTMYFRVKAQ